MNITTRDGFTYLMYAAKYWRFDVSKVKLCFENNELALSKPVQVFDILEIDTRFCALVDCSVRCNIQYINNLLAYIHEHRDEIRKFLNDFLSPEENACFLDKIRPSVDVVNINKIERHPVNESDGIPRLALGTAKKRFFIHNELGGYDEVSLATAISIYGREEVIEKCQQLDYLTGIGMKLYGSMVSASKMLTGTGWVVGGVDDGSCCAD